MRLLCLLLCLLVFGSGVPGQGWRSVLYGRGCARYASRWLFFSPPASAKRIRSFSGTPRTPAEGCGPLHSHWYKKRKMRLETPHTPAEGCGPLHSCFLNLSFDYARGFVPTYISVMVS